MPYAILIVGLQIFCGVHCMRHRRNFSWLFLILFAPLIGSIIYIAVEVWPSAQRRRNALDNHPRYRPSAKAERREQQNFRAAYRIDAQIAEAQKLMTEGDYQQAAEHFRTCLHGPLENDPELLYALAEASFAAQDFDTAIETLNKIRALSDFRPENVRCLLARVYAASGQSDKAETLFERLMTGTPSLESRYYYAVFLETFGSAQQAQQEFAKVLSQAELSPPGDEAQRWLEHARNAVQQQS